MVVFFLFALPVAAAAAEPPLAVSLTPAQMQSLGVVTQALPAAQAATVRLLPGRVTIPPSQIRVVAAPVAGLVEQVRVAAQQTVSAGTPLAVLASPMLLEAQREYLQAASQLGLAETTLRREEALHREGIIAEGRLLAAQAAHAQAQAAYAERRQVLRLYGMSEAAIAALTAARGLSGTLNLVAPAAGVVLEQLVQPGQRVEANTPLFRIARLAPLWIELQAGLADGLAIRPGARVSVDGARGRVVAVGASMDAASQSLPVRAELTTGLGALRPGQFVEARVESAAAGRAWRLPAAAVARHQGRAHVFVKTRGGFAMMPVTLLEEEAGQVVVSGNLPDQAQVAVKGVAALKAMVTGVGQD
ncbi:efflux RND transporter periplasmic adaptor subunit [Thiobacter aerophilum]|uniref:Efflux RND transporter periplasmic adaptor subunit n=1 Tax=Thiobacter aerophilum TaxID=3121275 RepID=A0ABV0EEG5_9BURK